MTNTHLKYKSVVRQVLLAVASIITIIAVFVATSIISERSKSVEQSVLRDLKIATHDAASGIHEFFRERSRVVIGLKGNPFLNDWFASYTERGSAIDNDPMYQLIVRMFKQISAQDPLIKSAFYAPAKTHEYFDINGRYNDPDYSTAKRPWWGEALALDRLFITRPEIDINDGSIVTSIKTTIYDDNNQLLGVAGIDVLASEVRSNLVDTMSYQGTGHGFLFTSDGQLIAFPDKANKIDMSKLPKLADVERIFSNSEGFSELTNLATSRQDVISEVIWQEESYLVVVSPIVDSTLDLDWRIGFMVPKSIVTEPVNTTIINSILLVVLVVALTSVVTVFAIKKLLTNPLLTIVKAMDRIATGDGDLTQRIAMNRNDELGRLSDSFDLFVSNIQQIIKQCDEVTDKVLAESSEVNYLTNQFSSNVLQQKGYIEQIAAATTEMTQTIHGISENAQSVLDCATQASTESTEGRELVNDATQLMAGLSTQVAETTDVVSNLHKNSESITAMLEVIKGIAEQTNLLALNAAIEAARAGEQGRGFAVVADEVRTLASRTQESAGDIEEIIAKLHQSAEAAVVAMNEGQAQTEQGVVIINQVNEKLFQISDAINVIEQQSNETASATKEQAAAADEISVQTETVNHLADETVSQTEQMASKSKEQESITHELKQTIAQFKVS